MTKPTWPFGKHKGKQINNVPKGYLKWALQECDLRGWYREAANAVLDGKPLPMTDQEIEEKANEIVCHLTSEADPRP